MIGVPTEQIGPTHRRGARLSVYWRGFVHRASLRPWAPGTAYAAPERVRAGEETTLTITYVAGAEGLPSGARLAMSLPQGWGGGANWSKPVFFQAWDPDKPGFVQARGPDGISLHLSLFSRGSFLTFVEVVVTEGQLSADEEISLLFAPAIAVERPGKHAIIVLVNDGHGYCRLARAPYVEAVEGEATRLEAVLPPVVAPGETCRLRLAALAGAQSCFATAKSFSGTVHLQGHGIADVPSQARLQHGRGEIALCAPTKPCHFSISANADKLSGSSNLSTVGLIEGRYRVFFGDLHLHSELSDGMGSPDENYRWARETAMLDFCAMNDHVENRLSYIIPWNEAKWQLICDAANRHLEEGRFVTFCGVEVAGNINVLFRHGDEPYYPYHRLRRSHRDMQAWLGEMCRRDDVIVGVHKPEQLPARLARGPQPAFIEVVQQKRKPGAGFHRFLHEPGRPVAFVGNTDSHAGLAGRPNLGLSWPSQFGLTGILAEECTRSSLFAALRAGRTFATCGQRSVVAFNVNGVGMGGTAVTSSTAPLRFHAHVVGSAPIARLEILCGRQTLFRCEPDSGNTATLDVKLPLTFRAPWTYCYLRVTEADGRMAWASPIWVIVTDAHAKA